MTTTKEKIMEVGSPEEKKLRNNLLHIVFHGTTKDKAEKILKEGFKPYTYFAKDLEEALCHGDYVFEVVFEHKYAPYWFENFRCWQIKNKNQILPEKIITLRKYPSPEKLFTNESIRDEVGKRSLDYYNKVGRYI